MELRHLREPAVKRRGVVAHVLAIGEHAEEGLDERVSRQTLVMGAILMSGGGLLWGALTLGLGLINESTIPLGYVVISIFNLALLARTSVFPRARTVQVFISLLLPFLFQAVLGGFINSGGVMLWAMIALVGSLTMSSARESRVWLLLYVVMTILSGVLDGEFLARATLRSTPEYQRLFFVVNVATISSIVFTLGLAITQRQRQAIEALEAGQDSNRLLTEKLTETVASGELDIIRLRAAETALTELAAGLEAQVAARTAELEAALVRAEAGTHAKSSFLAVMSHEIRTPLNGILGTADLLGVSRLDDEQQACLKLIRRSGDLLLTIINDVLDFSKIEAGRLELAPRTFELRSELEGVAALHRPAAADRGVKLELSLPEALPERVVGDPDRLLQIVGNLLGNAVKFTHEGSITLRLRFKQEADGLRLDFDISDTGIGIEAETLGRLFQPFTQADSSTTRRYGGTGLGLTICARLVELMSGHITVESQPGQGTTFRFNVRVGLPPAAELGQTVPLELRQPGGLGLRVLLAEDNPVNQAIGLKMLRTLGCEASVAPDGQVAIDMVSASEYDLVLMDMQMPVLDGLGSARGIRGLSIPRQPRIVALTANAYASDRQACLDAGMDDFMPKPLRLEQLRNQLSQVPPRQARAS